uniref:Kinesin family member 15 n=1 Tax=Chelydra serpentina TaxID=8475 RepID=A0A8C3SUK7_CHESE
MFSDNLIYKYSFISTEGDAIKVYVRVRPPSEGAALADGDQGLCLSVLSSNTLRLHSKPEPKIFTFDHVANMDTTQEAVFSSVAKNIVESCMNGYNGTIFAYGQTGSGKTFTMMGPSDFDNFTNNLRGVIPRSFEYLFFLIEREKEKAGTGKSFLCKCSFIEIYNEQIFDLLDSASAGLFLREHIKKGVFVVGAVEQVLTSAAEAYQVLTMGWRNRRVASTSMNRESSRSHAVFTITVDSMEKNSEVVNIRSSQLNLVDLAGSERQKDTHTEGVRLKEAGNINRSLSCLGQVITALVDVGNGKQRHICYRDSKLTFLLRDSLGGNAKTCIIANVHPGSRCFGETLSTLNFAQRAKLIKNKAVINEDTQGNVSQLQAEVKKLKEQLAQLTLGQSTQDISISRGRRNKRIEKKVAQLEDLCGKKEKFIQSNKMIVKFREDHIVRLERLHKEAHGSLVPKEHDDLIDELREELRTLREQMEQHPRIAKYAMENHSLREENKRLRSLQSVKRAQELDAQTIAELEKAFLEASATEKNNGGHQLYSTTTSTESNSSVSFERLKARLLHTQSELASSKQEYEEFKELTKKRHLEMESELQSLQKANQHLENILEATKAHKRHEVSQLNKMHRETIKEQLSTLQIKLDEEESKNIKLQQHIDKLEHHSAQMQELFSSERNDWNKEQQELLGQITFLKTQLQDTQSKTDILKSEVHDLRIVLQSADKELSVVKMEYNTFREKQEKEMSQLSMRHMDVQLQLDNVRLEHEKILEGKTSLQDDYDNLQEVMKFETDQLKQQLEDNKQESEALKTELHNLLELLETEKGLNDFSLLKLGIVIFLLLQEVVSDLMSQIQELRTSISHKTESIDGLTRELEDINWKYNSALAAKDENKAIIEDQERQIEELREALERKEAADKIELLYEDLNHTTEQLSKLTEASKKHAVLLQCAQEDLVKKEALIQELKEQVKCGKFLLKSQLAFTIYTAMSCWSLSPPQGKTLATERGSASAITLEHLVSELNEERTAKNDEILRLKGQLCELENLRLEMQILTENNRNLQSQLEEYQRERKNRLAEAKNALKSTESAYLEMTMEIERTKALESKTFQEKEDMRSKLEETCEERDKIEKEMDLLRKQVEFLAVENGKLVGHQNLNQKIQYLVKLKKDYAKLTEEVEKLRVENVFLKEIKKSEPCQEP